MGGAPFAISFGMFRAKLYRQSPPLFPRDLLFLKMDINREKSLKFARDKKNEIKEKDFHVQFTLFHEHNFQSNEFNQFDI